MALGYRLSEENFIKNLNLWTDLKVRGSYGVTGNQEIGNYQSLARLVTNLLYIVDNRLVTGARQSSLANQELTWEKSHQWDVGLDMAFLNNRLRFVVDYYKKDTRDLLFTINLPAYSGYSSALYNTGKLENRGVELELSADLGEGPFTWNILGNYAYNRSKMISLGRSGSTSLFVGYAPGVSLSYVYDGIFRNNDEIAAQTAQKGVKPGDIRYRNANNDSVFNANDRVIVGNPQPKHIFGLSNQLSYRGLSLSIFLQGELGRDGNKISRLFDPSEVASNKARALVDRWSADNVNGTLPHAGVSNWLTSTFLRQDLSYVKVRNVQLAYKLPARATGLLNSAQVYVSGQNLLTFTRDGYFGYDPDGGDDYPTSRTVLVGLNVAF
jgi:outer membrane receptor protein involved in Fe transport